MSGEAAPGFGVYGGRGRSRRVRERVLEFVTDERWEPWILLVAVFAALFAAAALVDLLFV